MRILICSIFFLFFYTSVVFATPLTTFEWKSFMASFQGSCKDEARKTSSMSRENIDRWCECVAYQTSKLATKEDLQPSQVEVLKQKTATAVEICRQVPNLLK